MQKSQCNDTRLRCCGRMMIPDNSEARLVWWQSGHWEMIAIKLARRRY